MTGSRGPPFSLTSRRSVVELGVDRKNSSWRDRIDVGVVESFDGSE